jgi:hypothetical protein
MKTARILFVFMVAALFVMTACGGGATAEPAPVAEQPQVVEQPPTAVPPAPPPAEPTALPEPTQPQFAPFCAAAPAGCAAPTVELLDNKYCIEKVPYVIMSVAAGTTYESQDPDMQCVDQLHSDGSLRVSCHSVTGKELWSYDLQVCNGACSAPALQMDSGQCPDGYGYDPANLCCAAPAPSGGDGCTTYRVDIGACPEPQE